MPRILPETVQCNLARCCAARPPGSTVHYIGAMLGRRSHNVRLTLRIDRSEVLPYLRSIGWWSSPSFRSEVFDDVPAFASSVVLNLDVGSVVAPGVGLEIKPDTPEDAPGRLVVVEGVRLGQHRSHSLRRHCDDRRHVDGRPEY